MRSCIWSIPTVHYYTARRYFRYMRPCDGSCSVERKKKSLRITQYSSIFKQFRKQIKLCGLGKYPGGIKLQRKLFL